MEETSNDNQRLITLLLNEQYELRTNQVSNEVLEEEELIYDSLGKGEKIITKMDRTISSMASLFSGALGTIEELNTKLDEATDNQIDNTIDNLKKDKQLIQTAIDDINEIGMKLKMASEMDKRIQSATTFDQSIDILNNVIEIYHFLEEKKNYSFYDSYLSSTKTHLESAYEKTLAFYSQVFVSISKPDNIQNVLSKECYIDLNILKLLKKAMPAIFGAAKILKANGQDVFSPIFENRKEYLLGVIEQIQLPTLDTPDEIVKYTVGYENGNNCFINSLKHILSLFQNERIFQQDILGEEFDRAFPCTTEEPFNAFEELYDNYVDLLHELDNPFILFPILDVFECYDDMKADITNALKVVEPQKQKNKLNEALQKGFSAISNFTFGLDKKDEEEDEDLHVEDETGDKRDSQTKKVDAFYDKMYENVKNLLVEFRDEILVDSTLNRIFSWTECKIPVDGTVSQLTADTMHYLSKFKTFLPKLANYVDRMYKEDKNKKDLQKVEYGYMGLYVLTCISNLCKMIESRAEKEKDKSRLGHIFKINNYQFIITVITSDDFVVSFGEKLKIKIESDLTTKKDGTISFYRHSLNNFYDTLKGRPGKSKDIKKLFSDFNSEFQSLHTISMGYSLYNDALKQELTDVLNDQIAKPYTLFYEHYKNNKFTQNPDKYFIYTPQTVNDCIQAMFCAKTDANGESKELTDYVPDFLKNVPHFLPKMSTLSSIGTHIANMPQHLKNMGHKPVDIVKGTAKVIKNPMKSSKKLLKKVNPFN